MAFEAIDTPGYYGGATAAHSQDPEYLAEQAARAKAAAEKATAEQAQRDLERSAYGTDMLHPEFKQMYDYAQKSKGFGEQQGSFEDALRASMGVNQGLGTQQQQQIQQLQALASGQQPSIAEQQAKMAQNQNIKNAMAMASSARGGQNIGLLQRQVGQQAAEGGQNIAAQSGIAKAQENIANQQLLANALASARQGATQMGGMQADLINKYMAAGLTADQAKMMAQLENRKIESQQGIAEAQIAASRSGQDKSLLGSLFPAAGSGMLSGAGEGLASLFSSGAAETAPEWASAAFFL